MTRLLSFVVLALAAAPLPAAAPARSAGPLRQRIDTHIRARADFAKFEAPRSSDAEFVRRIHLDLAGKIPSIAETRAFLADKSPKKREALIDRLLASPEHARHMATVFDVMLMERLADRNVPRADWIEFLRTSFEKNAPWDAMAREILSGDGRDTKQRHRIKFFVERAAEPNVVTRDIGRLFLGANLQCAQCHDHPRIEDYKQDWYYGLLAFVGRTTLLADRKTRVAALSEKADGETTFQSVFDPKKVTKSTMPRVPGGEPIKDPVLDKTKLYVVAPAAGVPGIPTYSRREKLASALVRADYAPFKRNIANRLWAHLMGRGLIEPLDMDHSDNPATHPELLDALADDIAARKFDMRYLLRELALSDTYQRSSELPDKVDPKNAPLYAAAILKPMTPEQLAWSLMEATGLIESNRIALGKTANEATINARLGANVAPFVRAFSSPAGQAQTFDARMDQALFVANGPTVRSWLGAGSVTTRVSKLKGDAIADELYLSIFSRLPDADERKDVAEFLTKRPGAFADLAWALLASTEFRFNH